MSIITTACPIDLWPAYVALRRYCAPDEATADAPPPGIPAWERDGVAYVVSSMPRPPWLGAAMQPLGAPPAWGADMALAAQAQAALVVWDGDGEPPVAQPIAITAILGGPGREALTLLGLAPRQPININTADKTTLQTLIGVGASLADQIISGRPWASPLDLTQIGGVSAGMVEGWMANPGLDAG